MGLLQSVYQLNTKSGASNATGAQLQVARLAQGYMVSIVAGLIPGLHQSIIRTIRRIAPTITVPVLATSEPQGQVWGPKNLYSRTRSVLYRLLKQVDRGVIWWLCFNVNLNGLGQAL